MKNARFKARSLDKSLFEEDDKRCLSDSKKHSTAIRIKVAPFNLNTDERGRKRQKPVGKKQDNLFKAKAMPTYKFFEPKLDESNTAKKIDFEEFSLQTADRSLKKQQSLKSTQE